MLNGLLRMAFFTVGTTLLSQWANHLYRSLPELSLAGRWKTLPSLSIIIPARNEAANLRRLLPSLAWSDYPGELEIIVVDDNSTDDTAVVARAYATTVVQLTKLPPGWLGKPYACHEGARVAGGKWLLFVDADTIHAPEGPAAAVAFAVRHGLDGLSLWLRNAFIEAADGVTLMVAFAGLFAGRRRADGILNGQYILLREDVYWEIGGHAAVPLDAMEDLALGQRLQQQHYMAPLLRGEKAAVVQMYRERAEWWSGLSRWGSRSLRRSGPGSLLSGLLITLAMYPLLMFARALAGRHDWKWVIATWFVVTANFVPWARRFGKGWWAAAAPFGALMVQVASSWGLIRDMAGRGASWKGRTV